MIESKIESFTPSQKVALEKIETFLAIKSNDIQDKIFVLSGMAGTGKTTIIKYALEALINEDLENFGNGFATPNVLGVTLAHKAKKVLHYSIPNVSTYASCFGLKQGYNPDGSIKFTKDAWLSRDAPCNNYIKVFVHDECSMYDEEMRKMVETDTNPYSKIIFMGDPGQLPPITSIGDEDSPVFTSYKHTAHLTERVRQTAGNPILELCDIIYQQIFRKFDYDNAPDDNRLQIVMSAMKNEKVIDGKGFKTLFYSDFLKDYAASSNDYMDSKVIAYRNEKVKTFNNHIRNHLLDHPIRSHIAEDIIYLNETYYHMIKGQDKPKWIMFNSDEYKIISVEESKIEDVHVYLLFVDKEGHSHLSHTDRPYIPVVAEDGMPEFNKVTSYRKYKANSAEPNKKGQAWKWYYEYKNKFGDVSYGYCYTGHKSQGSTYKNVNVDVNDILTVGPISTKRKLQALYTGASRASHLVNFLKSH